MPMAARAAGDERRHQRDDGGAARPVRQPPQYARERVQHDDDHEQQRLDERGRLHEAVQRLRQTGGAEQRAGEHRGVHREQDARDHSQIAEVRQDV